jgi:putative ABC transport system permease protein
MRHLAHDLRLGLRTLLRSPGFSIAAIIVLALGIGANTAIFSIVNAALLRPLPYPEPSRIMQIWHIPPAKSFPGMDLFSVSPANYLDWQSQSHSFDSMAAYGFASFNVGGKDRPEAIQAASVAADFFSVLRVQPALGRAFSPLEDAPGHGHVVLLGNKLWRDHFGSDPAIVGKNVVLNGETYNVIGVMAPRFRFPDWAELWVPLAWDNGRRAVRGNHNYLVIGRLKPGVEISSAKAELAAISARLEQAYPEDDKGWGATLRPLSQELVGDIRPALLVLFGAVAFVLLIACANVANLVLAKTLARRKEIAIRTALGATRADILRTVLAETILLSLAGGAVGLLLANSALSLLTTLLADRLPKFLDINLDATVLAFTVFLALFSGILAGLIPSLQFTKSDVNESLKQGQSRGSSDSGGNKTRSVLIVSEVALSLVLLIGAGLMIRTLLLLRNVNPGLDPNNVLTMTLPVPPNRFPAPSQQIAFFDQLLQHIRAVPGVESAGAIDSLPLDGGGSHQPVAIEGQPVVAMADQPEVDVRLTSPGYLRTMHIPILRGRDLNDSDVVGRVPVVLISQAMANRFWPNQDAIGKHLTLTFYPGAPREVVGIVGDIKLDSVSETRPIAMVYWPQSQLTTQPTEAWRSFGMNLAVRTTGDPMNSISSITTAIHEVDPEAPVVDVFSMNELISNSLSSQRFNVFLLSVFSGLALVLTAIGIYSVLSYAVRRRVREIGIRMALGATHSNILKLVVTDGMKPILLGLAIGLAASFALARVVSTLIFGISATDPLTFTLVALLLLFVSLIATILPASRATAIEPIRILREE